MTSPCTATEFAPGVRSWVIRTGRVGSAMDSTSTVPALALIEKRRWRTGSWATISDPPSLKAPVAEEPIGVKVRSEPEDCATVDCAGCAVADGARATVASTQVLASRPVTAAVMRGEEYIYAGWNAPANDALKSGKQAVEPW